MSSLAEILALNIPDGERRPPLLLAPMAGVTDWIVRSRCEAQGCDAATTEMISAQGFLSARKTRSAYRRLIARAPFEKPLIVQLFGHEPAYMAEAAHVLCHLQRYAGVDINMGCPARKVTGSGSGSALMLDEVQAGRIIGAVVKASFLPVSVKMRLGWDESRVNAPRLAAIAESEGAAFVTVHGRTTRQQYAGKADWEAIRRVREAVRIPVVANGDITDGESALRALAATGADALAIGRAALGNPWVFREARAALTGRAAPKPGAMERIAEARVHARALRAALPEARALLEMRKFFAWYIKGLRGAAEARVQINRAKTFEEIDGILMALALENPDCQAGGNMIE